jgi:hypothetical protein
VARENPATACGPTQMSHEVLPVIRHGRISFNNCVDAMPVTRAVNQITDQRRTLATFDDRGGGSHDVAVVIGGITFKYKTIHKGLVNIDNKYFEYRAAVTPKNSASLSDPYRSH